MNELDSHGHQPTIRIRTWTRGTDEDRRGGLLGYLALQFGPLALDGVTVRKTAQGKLTLSFPSRTDRAGRRHPLIRPLDDQARLEIEAEVLWQLGEREDFEP